MKNKKLIILALSMIILLVAAVWGYNLLSERYAPEDIVSTEEKETVPAPDFSVENSNGESIKLSSFKGKPVILNFWASWCGPCRSEFPTFEKLYNENRNEIEFMMINLTDGVQETKEKAKHFLSQGKYTFPVYYDTTQMAAYMYGIRSIPVTVFINADGNIVNARVGAMNENVLSSYVNELKGE